MGFETVAIARGTDKEEQARSLGAHHYIDSTGTDVAEALQALGGAQTILATVTAPDAMSAAVGGLRPRGGWSSSARRQTPCRSRRSR